MKLRILAVCFFVLSLSANAGLLLEPYVGYSFNGDGQWGSVNNEYSGIAYGGRLGYQSLGFMVGVDYSMQSFELEATSGSTTTKNDVKKNQLGIFVGYNFPIMLRVWGTYFLMGKLEGDEATGTYNSNREFSEGSGFAIGLGYKLMPFVSLNAEYRTIEYGKYEISGVKQTYNNKQDLSEILFSISLPFNL